LIIILITAKMSRFNKQQTATDEEEYGGGFEEDDNYDDDLGDEDNQIMREPVEPI